MPYTGAGQANKGKSNQKDSVYNPLQNIENISGITICFFCSK